MTEEESLSLLTKEQLISEYTALKAEYQSLREEFDQYQRESVKWSREDFIGLNESNEDEYITEEQAQNALEDMISHHDVSIGINWDTVEYYYSMYADQKVNDDQIIK